MLRNYFKIAIRNLQRHRLYTLINVLGITLGFSAAVVIYIFLSAETNFDSFHSNSSATYRIVQQYHTSEGTQFWNTTAYPLAEALRQEFPQATFAQAAGPMGSVISVQDGEQLRRFEEDKVLYADEHYLSVFDFSEVFSRQELWLAGSPGTAFNHLNAVVLTQSAASRYFSREYSPEELLGKNLRLNDQETLMVTGVIQDLPPNTSLSFEVLISYAFFKKHHEYQANNWSGNYQGTTFAVLPEQFEQADILNALAAVEKKHLSAADSKRIEWLLQPLQEVHTDTTYGSSPGSYVVGREIILGMMSLAVFLVLIACVNYINLATAQSLKRSQEVGVRKVLGASRKQLFLQYMIETFLISLVAAVLSLLLAKGVIDLINGEITYTQYNFSLNLDLLLFGTLLLLSITLLSCGYPALVLSRLAPVQVLKSKAVPARRRFSLRQLLIVFQFSAVQLLIAGTIIVASQMHYFRNKDLGYNKEAVLTVPFPDTNADKQEAFRQRLMQNSGIERLSFASGTPTPYGRKYGTSFRLAHEPEDRMRRAEMMVVDQEYLAVYELEVVAGNWVAEANKTEEFNGFVVNEALVRMLGGDPDAIIGKQLVINEGEAPVIGVVKDFHNNGLQEEISPCVHMYWGAGFLDQAHIRLAGHAAGGAGLSAALSAVEESWKAFFPDATFNFTFVDDSLAQHYILEKMVYKVFRIASAVAIFLGCLGLYGLVSFVAVQRTKEVGIRKVLGASVANILRLLTWDFVKLLLIAVTIATPVAWYLMQGWLQGFAHRISLEWWHFFGAGVLTLFIALATVSYQAIKAARANPVKNLRTE